MIDIAPPAMPTTRRILSSSTIERWISDQPMITSGNGVFPGGFIER